LCALRVKKGRLCHVSSVETAVNRPRLTVPDGMMTTTWTSRSSRRGRSAPLLQCCLVGCNGETQDDAL
jgi:hypothetical protein